MKKELLLDRDERTIGMFISHYKSLLPLVDKVREEYIKLNIGQFSKEVFCNLERQGLKFIDPLLEQRVINEMDNLKIHSSARAMFFDNIESEMAPLKKALSDFNTLKAGYSVSLNASHFDFNEMGIPVLSEAKTREFQNQFSSFTDNENERKVYSLVNKIIEAINDLNNNMDNESYQPDEIGSLINYNNGKYVPSVGIKYAAQFIKA